MKRLLIVMVFIASAAYGEIYTWIDSRGTAHYTNSMYEIPERYRAKVKVLDLGMSQKADTSPPQQDGQTQPLKPEVRPGAQKIDGTQAQQNRVLRQRTAPRHNEE